MSKTLAALIGLILVVGIGSSSWAFETDFDDLQRFDRNLPGWKFGRGIVNMISAPDELFTAMTNNAIKGAYYGAYDGGVKGYLGGSTNGMIAGIFPGTTRMLRRFTLGVLEILTFWKPEYGPTMDPQWGTRCLAWPAVDYFNPDPFWYNSVER
jgi:hypothetical protein